ncbi:MAG: hypothetical protein AAGB28_04155 [Pseudomonadota bacterium]
MRLACVLGSAWLLASAATAQQNGLSIELNTHEQADSGCQLTFVANTSIAGGVEKVVFETVLFNTDGGVDLLTLFDFGAIPAGSPRVRQFILPNTQCVEIGKILINGVQTCSVADQNPGICSTGLSLSSRTNVEMQG